MKKLVSILLAATTAVSASAILSGCGNDNYPVKIANYTIDEEPHNVVILDAATADIVAYMDYERKIAGRSNSVIQEELKSVENVGSESNPDVNRITALKADMVFANESLNASVMDTLNDKDIKVIKFQNVQNTASLKTNYETIGKILGGNDTGYKWGTTYYEKLIDNLEKQKRDVEELSGTGALKTLCYLYLNGNKLEKLNNGFGNILMDYTNCVNISTDKDVKGDTASIVANANPNYIIYDNEATLKAIKADPSLSKINAVKNNKLLQIPLAEMSLPGITAIKTLTAMNKFIYSDNKATPDEPATKASSKTKTTQPATQNATQPASSSTQPTTAPATTAPKEEDLSSKYKIKLDDLSLKRDDENDNVKAMQIRLADLGYVKNNDDYVTGYYGEQTEKAVKAFQNNNGIKDTGNADNATLKAMFMSSAKKAE